MGGHKWAVVTIGSLLESGAITAHKDGNYGSQYPRVEEFGSVGVPFLTAKSLKEGKIDIDGAPRLSNERANELPFGFVQPGDVLLSHNATIGRVAVVPKFEGRLLVGTSLTYFRVDPTRISPGYLAAYFSASDFQNQLAAVMSLSTRNQVPITAQRRLRVALPPLDEQNAMAHILGTLDNKIELNRQMNETLEAIARTLFKSWFVDLNFASAKTDVPVRWTEGKFGDVADNNRNQVNPSDTSPTTPYIGLEHMPRKSISLSDWGIAGDVASNKFAFKTGDILFGKLRPYFHKVGVAVVNGVCSTDILVICAKEPLWFSFVLGHASSSEMVDFADAGSTGTKMPRTSWDQLSQFEIAIPPRQLAEKFNNVVLAYVEKMRANVHESRTLASLRDALLPRLVTGEIQVKHPEEIVEAHA